MSIFIKIRQAKLLKFCFSCSRFLPDLLKTWPLKKEPQYLNVFLWVEKRAHVGWALLDLTEITLKNVVKMAINSIFSTWGTISEVFKVPYANLQHREIGTVWWVFLLIFNKGLPVWCSLVSIILNRSVMLRRFRLWRLYHTSIIAGKIQFLDPRKLVLLF